MWTCECGVGGGCFCFECMNGEEEQRVLAIGLAESCRLLRMRVVML